MPRVARRRRPHFARVRTRVPVRRAVIIPAAALAAHNRGRARAVVGARGVPARVVSTAAKSRSCGVNTRFVRILRREIVFAAVHVRPGIRVVRDKRVWRVAPAARRRRRGRGPPRGVPGVRSWVSGHPKQTHVVQVHGLELIHRELSERVFVVLMPRPVALGSRLAVAVLRVATGHRGLTAHAHAHAVRALRALVAALAQRHQARAGRHAPRGRAGVPGSGVRGKRPRGDEPESALRDRRILRESGRVSVVKRGV
mmetsp:Transcript_9352/g.39705  ORF Transcript_9352/g.39705 Transcript_9352/m.39705 type:complete len:255 (-) Transcript_9352:1691-2455(-)